MQGTFLKALAIAAMASLGAAVDLTAYAESTKPNIVHIFADDLGWGSVGFNGQEKIETPHLDQLARDGMVLANSYAATVCAPSRCMLYTGFHQGHAVIDRNGGIRSGFRQQDVMTPQVLARAGYRSAIFGKWGFGADGQREIGFGADPQPKITSVASLPGRHGFAQFYGYLNHSAAHDYYYQWMWASDESKNGKAVTQRNDQGPGGRPQYTHDLIAAKCDAYIRQHGASDAPMYLQINYTIPHFDIDGVADAPGGLAQYADTEWTFAQKAYAAMISRMDASIGAVVARLDDPNGDGDPADSVLENTLIMFSSDNGPTPEDQSPIEFFDANGVYRGGKRDLYEGGIHVPTLAYWKGAIEPGSSTEYRTDLADVMATAADLAGVEAPVGIDGVSLAPTLTGQGRQQVRRYLAFEHHEKSGPVDPDPRAARWAVIRQDGMKLIRYDDDSSDLFNVADDPAEAHPLDQQDAAHAEVFAELEAAAAAEGLQEDAVERRTFQGADGDSIADAKNWSAGKASPKFWIAVVAGSDGESSTATVDADFSALGIEVRGKASPGQTVVIVEDCTLAGRNEVRIAGGGAIELDGGALATNRRINIRAEGRLGGHGAVAGEVVCDGVMAPQDALTVDGEVSLQSGSRLVVPWGENLGSDGALAASGDVYLEGDLEVELPNDEGKPRAPQLGETCTIVAAGGQLHGRFAEAKLPELGDGVQWRLDYANDAVTLSVVSAADK